MSYSVSGATWKYHSGPGSGSGEHSRDFGKAHAEEILLQIIPTPGLTLNANFNPINDLINLKTLHRPSSMGSGIGLSGSSSGSLRPKTSPDNAQIRNLCKSAFDSLVAVGFKLPWCCLCSFSVCSYLVVLQGLGDRKYLTLQRDPFPSIAEPESFPNTIKKDDFCFCLGVLGF